MQRWETDPLFSNEVGWFFWIFVVSNMFPPSFHHIPQVLKVFLIAPGFVPYALPNIVLLEVIYVAIYQPSHARMIGMNSSTMRSFEISKLLHDWAILKRLVAKRKTNFACTFQLITVDYTKIT
jgi:hypothetical protein